MTTDPWQIIGDALGAPAKPDHPPRAPYILGSAAPDTRYAASALEQEAQRVIDCPPGGRNHALNRAAYSLGQLIAGGALREDNVIDALEHAGRQAGLDDREISLTIRSGLHAGAEQPRGIPERQQPTLETRQVVDEVTGEIVEQPLTPEEAAAKRHEYAVRAELASLRARDEAKTLYASERAALTFREPPSVLTLREQLLLPRDPITYAIESLLPSGGNALLTAQYKSGKTTFMANLLRSYADNELFLGRFTVSPRTGRIAIFNYELSPAQFDTWLEQAGIVNQERVSVLHLRGYRLPLTVPRVEDWIVGWLKEHDVSFWIADPFARAAVGTDENSNTEVGVWLDTFDVIKERAGVSEGVLPTHTGRAEQESGSERARGATRLDDWADVRWIMTKDKQDTRFFRATGRDVELSEEKLSYDEATRTYRIGGGDRRWVERRAKAQTILDYINANPGCSGRQIQLAVGGNKDLNTSVRIDLIARHKVRVEQGNSKQGEMHFANTTEA